MNYPALATDAYGFFTATVTTLPHGTYSYRVKHPKYLAAVGTAVLDGRSQVNVEIGSVRAGDANNDNLIGILDFNIQKLTFGKGMLDVGYDDRADFTGDQQVTVLDFTLMKLNFGASGGPPTGPAGVSVNFYNC